jgi:acetyl-CoA carboxylase biotin carboxyl carrier protein
MTQVKKRAGIEIDVVRQLADVLNASGLTEIEYDAGDWRVRVARTAVASAMTTVPPGAPPPPPGVGAPAAAEAASGSNESFSGNPGLLTSPMVGVVYTAQEPSAPPFVKPGDPVSVGDTVLLIEAMKVFNPIKAHCSGRIERIFVNSGMPVEFGEPLLLII